jgi:tetratricopeptide (TPR) repeat protein
MMRAEKEQAEPDSPPPRVFVGREQELEQLGRYLRRVLIGRGQVSFVSGEAGTGKTALVTEFARRVQQEHDAILVTLGTCNAQSGIGDPFLPFREILGLLSGDTEPMLRKGLISTEAARRLRAVLVRSVQVLVDLGPDLVNAFLPGAGLLAKIGTSTIERAGWMERLDRLAKAADGTTQPKDPITEQSRIFEQYTGVLRELSTEHPLLVILDDLHWADASSISLLFHLVRRIETNRILIVGTYRPEEVALGRAGERHPLERVINEVERYYGDIAVDLGRAQETEGRHFVDALLDAEPNQLDEDFREALYQLTGGHALFTVELLRTLQLRGDLVKDAQGRWVQGPDLEWAALPARIEGVIEERVDRLGKELQEVLSTASVEGRDFTAEVVAQVLQRDERLLVRQLSGEADREHRLVRAQGVQRTGQQRLSAYQFVHNLYHRYLYDRLDQVERSYLHEDVGRALETLYGSQAKEIAGQLARHFQQAGIADKAIAYHLQVAHQAARATAYEEAIAHIRQSLDLIRSSPEVLPDRTRHELDCQTLLGSALVAVQGWASPEAEQAYVRASELARQLGDAQELSSALYGLANIYELRGEYQKTEAILHDRLQVPNAAQEPDQLLESYELLSCSNFHQGSFTQSLDLARRGLVLYGAEQRGIPVAPLGEDLGVSCHAWGGLSLWFLGYPDQALSRVQSALELAKALSHSHSVARATMQAASLYHLRREPRATQEYAETVVALSTEHGLQYPLAVGTLLQGWAMAAQGQAEGIEQVRAGLDAHQRTGAQMDRPYYLALLAQAYSTAGRYREGLATLDEGIQMVSQGRTFFFEAELYRLKGEYLLQDDRQRNAGQAESHFQRALERARAQQARSLELRTALSLARLWQEQGKSTKARQLLHESYGWFTEGFDSPDLVEAQHLLTALRDLE